MPKDAYYFSHDSNAHKDTKCIRLRRIAGMAGYGLFWCIIEMLRDAPEFKMQNSCIEDILFELRCDIAQWDALIESGLIKTDGISFWSDSLLRRMTKYHETREQRSRAGKRSAESRASSTSVEHPLNDNSTSVEHPLNEASTESNKVKESKVKESKEEIASSATADKADAHKPSRKIALTDDEFINSLEANPAYTGIDVRREYGKMCAWLASPRGKGKFPTRQRFLNWLNRCDQTMSITHDDNYDPETGGHKHVVL